jgi:hypothetical protein
LYVKKKTLSQIYSLKISFPQTRSEKSRLLGIENSGTTGTFISRVCGSENTAENYPVHSGFNSLSDPPEGFPLPTSRREYGFLISSHYPIKDFCAKLGDVVEFLHFTKVLSYDKSLLWLGRLD